MSPCTAWSEGCVLTKGGKKRTHSLAVRNTLLANLGGTSRRAKHRHSDNLAQNVRREVIDCLDSDKASLAMSTKGKLCIGTCRSLLREILSHISNTISLRCKAEAGWIVNWVAGGAGNENSNICKEGVACGPIAFGPGLSGGGVK